MKIIRAALPSDLEKIHKFRDKAIREIKANNIDEDLVFKIRLILDELIANSYKHGNNCDCNKKIETLIVIDKKSCLIKVKDEGHGIDYFVDKTPYKDHGRGIKLVYTLADDLIIKNNSITALLLRDSKTKFYL